MLGRHVLGWRIWDGAWGMAHGMAHLGYAKDGRISICPAPNIYYN